MLDVQSAPPAPPASSYAAGVAPRRARRQGRNAVAARDAGSPARPRAPLASRACCCWTQIGFALLAQVMIYVPRLATVRDNYLRGRLAAANTAALVFAASPDNMLPKELAGKILDSVGAKTIALKTRDTHRLLAVAEMPPVVSDTYDLRDPSMAEGISGAFRAMFAKEGAVLRVLGPASMNGAFLDITLDETPLTAAMWRFTRNFLSVVMTISAVVVLVIWASIWLMVLRPVRRLRRPTSWRSASGPRTPRGSFRRAAAATKSALPSRRSPRWRRRCPRSSARRSAWRSWDSPSPKSTTTCATC